MTEPRFEDVTEGTGAPVTDEGARMIATRYAVAAEFGAGGRVLELGCGAGLGLGLLAGAARSVVGGDYSAALLRVASAHYRGRVPLVRLSAESLPFRRAAFDRIVFFEATYYVPDMEAAFGEIARVLGPTGAVLFVNANPERPDFIASPHSRHYHTADEFRAALARRGFTVTAAAAFPVGEPSPNRILRVASGATMLARRALQALGLVPTTLRGRARLKRLVYRRLRTLPAELPAGFATVEARHAVPAGPVAGYKVIYVHAWRPRS